MYPVAPRLFLGVLLFFEVYFLILLNHGVGGFNINHQEFIGGLTIFSFLMSLRIADDFKDYETDLKLFPERALPSGKVTKKDLAALLAINIATVSILNILFMNNLIYFFILMVYGSLMSLWFFNKAKIQNSLPLALITHNPVQFVLNLYIISFTCIKYGLPIFNVITFIALFAFYFPALAWEVARKIRAPKDETAYTTYSKIFGYKKATLLLIISIFCDMLATSAIVFNVYKISSILNAAYCIIMISACILYIKKPERAKLINKVEAYVYIAQISIVISMVIKIML
jgi:4-hydroxybenzoate polyprenyltransferase